jgi:hypothetical protein
VVTSSTTANTFNCDSYVANPGKNAAFSWLSTLASNYDKYKFRKLVIHYTPNVGTSVNGKVGIGFDYDSTDDVPVNRQEFFTLTHHAEVGVWSPLTLNVPTQGGIRFTNTHTSTDSKLIDLGQILVMTDLVATTSTTVGDLLVEYDVDLIDPQQSPLQSMAASLGNGTPIVNRDIAAYFQFVSGLQIPISTKFIDSTNLRLAFGSGAYHVLLLQQDAGAGTPSVVITVSGALVTGLDRARYTNQSSTTLTTSNIWLNFPGTGYLNLNLGTVAVANLENLFIQVTRVSPTILHSINTSNSAGFTAL